MTTIRRAMINDVAGIIEMIQPYVDDGTVLPVPAYRLYERIRDFVVAEADGQIVGCGSLMIMWYDLAEIRSLVVRKGHQGGGVGRRIVDMLVAEARDLRIARVFALTLQTGFFARLGFHTVEKEALPHKVWKDCTQCPKFTHCDEIAMIMDLIPASEIQSALLPSTQPADPDLLMPAPAD